MVIFLADQTVSAQSLCRAGRPGGLCQGSVGNCRIAWCTVGTVSGTVGLSASVGLWRRVLTAHAHGDCRNLIMWHCRSLSVTVGHCRTVGPVGLSDLSRLSGLCRSTVGKNCRSVGPGLNHVKSVSTTLSGCRDIASDLILAMGPSSCHARPAVHDFMSGPVRDVR